MSSVFITRTNAYLPFDPISNDEMEDVLGRVNGKNSRARSIILRSNGIKSRHYVIDKKTGKQVLNNSAITARAVEGLGELGKVGALYCGTTLPDSLVIGHANLVQEHLKWGRMEVASYSGVCLSSTTALKGAYLALSCDEHESAVVTGSEAVSPYLLAELFKPEVDSKVEQLEERPEIAFEQDFLRWMLSDGAAALFLQNQPMGECPLKIQWIETGSAAHLQSACMYAGAVKNEDDSLRGWATMSGEEQDRLSVFSLKQDVRLLNDNIVPLTFRDPFIELMEKRKINPSDIDWYLPHVSSMYFYERAVKILKEIDFEIPQEKWFTNLTTKGNTGSASAFIMLDELVRSGKLRPGQNILLFVPESGRFSSGFIYLTVHPAVN